MLCCGHVGMGGVNGYMGRFLQDGTNHGSEKRRRGGWEVSSHTTVDYRNQISIEQMTAGFLSPGPALMMFLLPTDVPRLHQDAPRAVHPHRSF